ncbi:unnamed protein product, partial [Adineta ricciae]
IFLFDYPHKHIGIDHQAGEFNQGHKSPS